MEYSLDVCQVQLVYCICFMFLCYSSAQFCLLLKSVEIFQLVLNSVFLPLVSVSFVSYILKPCYKVHIYVYNSFKMSVDKPFFNLFFDFYKSLFICFWLHWVFIAVHGLSSCMQLGPLSSCSARASSAVASFVAEHRLQMCGPQQSWLISLSNCDSWAPEHRPSNRGAWAVLACLWLVGSSPALQGGFLTSEPPGKPLCL